MEVTTSSRPKIRLAPVLVFGIAGCLLLGWFLVPDISETQSPSPAQATSTAFVVPTAVASSTPEVAHVPLPTEVRGIYWTAVTARSKRADELMAFMKASKLNAVVIDLKMDNGELAMDGLETVLEKLREQGVYRIARVAVMRDSTFALAHPDAALHVASGALWRDRTGARWLDPAAPIVTQTAIDIGKRAYALGFDEIQYDYVRYPSDGSISSIRYAASKATSTKASVMRAFFENVGTALHAKGIAVSFDVFGMTFWSGNDYGIGQRLNDAYPYGDFISPMVYPSHYYPGFQGFRNPALYPYEVVKRSLDKGVETLQLDFAMLKAEEARKKFRPWLQDFNMGAVYGPDKVAAQIKAARDAGASGWMLWNAANKYGAITIK